MGKSSFLIADLHLPFGRHAAIADLDGDTLLTQLLCGASLDGYPGDALPVRLGRVSLSIEGEDDLPILDRLALYLQARLQFERAAPLDGGNIPELLPFSST